MLLSIATKLANLNLKNPLIVGSGISSNYVLKQFIDAGVAAVTTKTVTPEARKGHPPPTVLQLKEGYINAIGLKNPGIENYRDQMIDLVEYAKKRDVKVIGSAGSNTITGLLKVSTRLEELGADAIELNVSCPNADDIFSIGFDLNFLKTAITEVRKVVSVPIGIKMSPEISDMDLLKYANILKSAGADFVVISNSFSPATSIDIWKQSIRLGRPEGYGGLSGPAIKPLVLGKILRYHIIDDTMPIVGIGGVTTWEDVIEFMLAGASAVSFVSAYFIYKNVSFIKDMLEGIKTYMEKMNIQKINEIVGLVKKKMKSRSMT
ncbi:MAG: dihydroorotate dehydrogenase [Fervidicoccaceae archaeon]